MSVYFSNPTNLKREFEGASSQAETQFHKPNAKWIDSVVYKSLSSK